MTFSSVLEPSLEVSLSLRPKADWDPLVAMMAQSVSFADRVVPDTQRLRRVKQSAREVADAVVKLHVVEVLAAFHRIPFALRTERTPAFASTRASTCEARGVEIAWEQVLHFLYGLLGLLLSINDRALVVLHFQERVGRARVRQFFVA